jgi:hypothetical protein
VFAVPVPVPAPAGVQVRLLERSPALLWLLPLLLWLRPPVRPPRAMSVLARLRLLLRVRVPPLSVPSPS